MSPGPQETSSERTWRLEDVLRAAREYLEQRGAEAARLDAELLLARALGCSRLDLYLRHAMPLSDADRAACRALIQRRGAGEPTAYILGEREFHGLTFQVDPRVLVPRPETEHLVDAALQHLEERRGRAAPARVLDVGTGSGCIAIAIAARFPDAHIVATDVSPDAIDVARANAAHLVPDASIAFLAGDLLEPARDRGPFDVIASNPPYIEPEEAADLPRDVRDHEPRQALFAEGGALSFHRRLLRDGAPRLAAGGVLLLELPEGAGREFAELAQQLAPGLQLQLVRDLGGVQRVAVLRAPGGGAA